MNRNFFKLYLEQRYNLIVRDNFTVKDFFEEKRYLLIEELSGFVVPEHEEYHYAGLYFLHLFIWSDFLRFLLNLVRSLMLNKSLNTTNILSIEMKDLESVNEAAKSMEKYTISWFDIFKWKINFITDEEFFYKVNSQQQKKINRLEDRLKDSQNKCYEASFKIVEHNLKESAYEEEINRHKIEKQQYLDKLNEWKLQCEILQKSNSNKDEKIKRLEKGYNKINRLYKEALLRIKAQDETICELNRKIEEQQKTISDQKTVINTLQNKVETLTQKTKNLEHASASQNQKVQDLKDESVLQKEVMKDLIEQLNKDKKERKEFQERLNKLETAGQEKKVGSSYKPGFYSK